MNPGTQPAMVQPLQMHTVQQSPVTMLNFALGQSQTPATHAVPMQVHAGQLTGPGWAVSGPPQSATNHAIPDWRSCTEQQRPADYIPSWVTEGHEPGWFDTNFESSYRASAAGERYAVFISSVWPTWTAAHVTKPPVTQS